VSQSVGEAAPYFSVIIPMYNRSVEIGRAIDSCMAQTDPDFEIIVVDDCSTDSSVERVRGYADQRIRLLLHEDNRGACAARNTAASEALGAWLVFLDSDDELVPDALRIIRSRIVEGGQAVDKLLLMCRHADGRISPDPPFPSQIWQYEDYISWLGRMVGRPTEAIPVTRRAAFLQCPYEDGHAPEGLHELNFVKRFKVFACPDVVRVYHQDAVVRLISPPARWLRDHGIELATAIDAIIANHGMALERHSRPLLLHNRRASAYFHFWAGNRLAGLRQVRALLRLTPLSATAWGLGLLGIMGPWAMALARELRK
jgi:glycosyltransferase involved in cell wall biosynthesis